jgi:DNA-binding MarR family transcriptional regulator
MVKNSAQGLPEPPAGLADDATTLAANALHSAALRLLRQARTADAGMDLDGPRASVLSVLVFAGPLPLTRLADLEQVSPPAITKTVTALEAAGLATRTRSEEDRRVVLVAATDAGRALLEQGRAARVRVVAELIAGLPERDRATLQRAATLIASVLSP